jgi:hypothetical protein
MHHILTISKFVFRIYGFRVILDVNNDISLNINNQVIFIMKKSRAFFEVRS